MNAFMKRAAIRIAVVTVFMALLASSASWFVARHRAEESVVALAIEDSRRILSLKGEMTLVGPQAAAYAAAAAKLIAGGLFEIAEIYDGQGKKLAESHTVQGAAIEDRLPEHHELQSVSASYENLGFYDGKWVVRVFVPLRDADAVANGLVSGYLEGVRFVPKWQEAQILSAAMSTAFMVCLASLLCGIVLFPVVVYLSKDNERKTYEVLDSHISMMESLGRAIAKRDSDTGAHNYRVAWIAARIAESMGVKGNEMQALIAGSFLHDVGKIGIPDSILLKPAKLDAGELQIMRTHVAQGEEIVSGLGWLAGAHVVVAGHHEKWDGTGYPRGLSGEQIPLSARIFAVADVFDALCSVRPYKPAFSFDEAMAILERDNGSHFDPDVMEVFKSLSGEVFRSVVNQPENQARQLLETVVRRHFDI